MQASVSIDEVERSAQDVGAALFPLRVAAVSFSAGDTRILDCIDLDIRLGAPTVLMGPNGSGKTTLLKLAMGLLTPTSGCITFAGRDPAPPGSRAMVLQRPVMLRRTAAANVAFALRAASLPPAPGEIQRLLDLARIGPLALRPARLLSGGEQQRLALARALARRPHLLLLDEPTANLDPAATRLVEDIVAEIAASGVKIVMATHDIGQARRIAGDVVLLAAGRIVEHAPAARFFASPATEIARRFLAGDLLA